MSSEVERLRAELAEMTKRRDACQATAERHLQWWQDERERSKRLDRELTELKLGITEVVLKMQRGATHV